MISLFSRRECFFDDYLIDTAKTTAPFLLHEPIRREMVLRMDMPWEGSGSSSLSLIKDDGIFRLYYNGRSMDSVTAKRDDTYYHCYAQSRDGIHWERPVLNLFSYEGSCENNISSSYAEGLICPFCVFKDENPACLPAERYKAVVCCFHEKYGGHALLALMSADGIHFDMEHPRVIEKGGFYDSKHSCFWDKNIGKYRLYTRGFHLPDGYTGDITDAHDRRSYDIRIRDIQYLESEDFVHWSPSRRIDQGDAADIELYENLIMPYYRAPHQYIGFPTRYVGRRQWTPAFDELPNAEHRRRRYQIDARFGLAITDCTFLTGRDGVRFKRYDEAFLRPGAGHSANWLYGDGYPATCLFETPSDLEGGEPEISMLVPIGHWIKPIEVWRYTIRRDGFVSLHAGGKNEEIVITKPFTFTGENLYVNLSTSACGYLYFTLTAEDGTRLESYETFGDASDLRVHFKNGSVGDLAGKTVTLSVRMRDADLYAIRFA